MRVMIRRHERADYRHPSALGPSWGLGEYLGELRAIVEQIPEPGSFIMLDAGQKDAQWFGKVHSVRRVLSWDQVERAAGAEIVYVYVMEWE